MKRIPLVIAVTAALGIVATLNAATVDVPVGSIATGGGGYVLAKLKVGEPLTLRAVGASAGSVTWRDPDHGLARFGGVILGYGPTLTTTPTVVGNSRITLTYSVNTGGRFYRTATTYVYITAVAP